MDNNLLPDISTFRTNGNTAAATKRLQDEVLAQVVLLFAQGYTVRKIRLWLVQLYEDSEEALRNSPRGQGGVLPTLPTEAELLKFALEFGTEIGHVRRQIAEVVLNNSLIRPEARITRLSELAEAWEDTSKTSTKAASILIRTLEQLRREAESAGIKPELAPDDPWMQLLAEMKTHVLKPHE